MIPCWNAYILLYLYILQETQFLSVCQEGKSITKTGKD